MITDKLEHLKAYTALHPLFGKVLEFVQTTDLNMLENGKHVLQGDELWFNVEQTLPKTKEEALLEAHRRYIDIQIPLTATEVMGYAPLAECNSVASPYNEAKDIAFFTDSVSTWLTLPPGRFAIFFPQDAHAPAVTPEGVRKIVFKIKTLQ
ncbi:MAG: YhcH/YjgK/YiaL family protein [Bacteroides sp.]|nr:YhcH/YjgK/YiaL family protein [Bacteroides sp.]